ncbi:MAG: PAS domain S-box protein [Burkholderiales bacterium]
MSTPPDPWSSAAGWREFFDLLSDAVVVLDGQARVVLANTAALRLLPCEAGAPIDQLRPTLGAPAIAWLKRAVAGEGGGGAPSEIRLADGRAATLAWRRLDAQHSALHLAPAGLAHGTLPLQPAPRAQALGGMREAIGFLWDSPFPTSLQGPDFHFLDVNQAFAEFLGRPRDQIVGRDAVEFQPEEDRPRILAARERIRASNTTRLPEPAMVEGRLIDAGGRERRYRVARRTLVDEAGRPLYLGVLQDATAEHVARERAERSLRELDDWFDLSPVGMVLFDERGLLLRSNPAFDALTGAPPVTLADATPELRTLLGWDDATGLAELEPGSLPVQRQGSVTPQGKAGRLLRAVLRCYRSAGGQRRYMAVLEDRSAEEERDLAQLQIGALMDTAGVGLATFQESSGWVRQGHTGRVRPSGAAGNAAALQSIGRDLVAPGSIAEFERLQSALRLAQRAEVRYAIDHPELGRRWLLTRVEPATLASGKRTTSVVTLDITEQHETQHRTEQLLHELSTILESTTAGIAYLRGDVLARCNRRFETMLGLASGSVVGRTLEELFAGTDLTGRIVTDAWQALTEGTIYETEFDVRADAAGGEATRWYSLSVRRAGPSAGLPEAIAVLVDITRLRAQQRELETLARDRELMFSLSGVGIAFLRDGRIQRANQALAHLAGCSVAELSTLALSELFPDVDEFERRWSQTESNLRQYGHWTGERPLRMRDGRLLWVQVSKRLVTAGDPAGGIIASYVNVDARHRAERAVALQAGRTRSILDSVLVGIVTVGPQGIEWMNRSARRMFGGDLADFLNLPIATVATADPNHPFLRTEYLTELVEGQAETFECRVQARDGREFWVVGNVVSTARESTGRQLTYALLDIERRREAEARMSQAQAQLQRIIEAAPLAITLRDARTLRVLQVNGVAAANGLTTPEALIGLAPEQIFDTETAAQRRRDMEQALASPDVSTHEYRLERDGETRIWDARYLPLSTAPGAPPDQLLLVATDVTEQRAAQEARYEAAIAQREMLVKEVHHRIKNNLQGVAGLLQQIAQRKPEVAGPIAEVVGQVQAIAQVYGLQVGESGPLQLMSVVKAISESVQRTFGRPIRFAVIGPSAPQWMLPEAESIPIALTLNELLTNAVKHGAAAPQSELSCTLQCDEAEVTVTIANHGTLPPAFNLARIPGGVSGLGLVRALLPRRSAALALDQRGEQVLATVALKPPGVTRLDTV